MADLEGPLAARASELAPTAGQRQGAARSHRHLRDLLSTGKMDCRIRDDYLTGSYARHTAIRPLDDVDIVFEIDPGRWPRSWLDRMVGSRPHPDAVLLTFARAIRRRYPTSRVITQRRSVGLAMFDLQIDVVPAVPHEEHDDWLRIPDRKAESWIATAPRMHAAIAESVNKECGGQLKPLVRLLKGWNATLPSTTRLKSFAVETMATRLMRAHPRSTLTDGTLAFFDFVAWRGGAKPLLRWGDSCDIAFGALNRTVPDVGGTGSNLLAGVSGTRMTKFVEAARVTRDALVAASKARTTETGWARLDCRFLGGLKRL